MHSCESAERLLSQEWIYRSPVKVPLLVQIMMKSAAEESIERRIRRCWLASALVAFSQGIAFFHAGDEILRSKSLDRDSYNSGAC